MPSDPVPAPRRAGASLLLVLLLVGAALLRLPGLGSPPTDIHHVRQADTSSIARNFYRDGVDLLRPRIDWAGPDAGTVESELPLYAAATAGLWRAAGTTDPAWPRALSVLSWMLGALALWRLVRRRLEGPAWPYLALYLLSPLAIAFSRTVQPDASAVALLLWSLERCDAAGDRDGGGLGAALWGGLLGGLAVAAKGTLGFAAPMLLLLAVGRGGKGASLRAAATALLTLTLPALWYAHAHANLGVDGATFGLWGSGAHKWGGPAIWADLGTWRALVGTLLTLTLTPLGAVLVGAGVLAARLEAGLRPWVLGLGLGLGTMVVLAEGFRLHNYYQLMLVPFASVLAGAGARWAAARAREGGAAAAGMVVLLLALGALSAWQGLAFARDALRRDSRIEVAGLALSYVVPANHAVLVVDEHPQTLLYAIDRRGFHRSTVSYGDVLQLEDLGAEYLVITETSPSWSDPGLMTALEDERPLVARSPGWLLFQLQKERPRRVRPVTSTEAAVEGEGAEGGDEAPAGSGHPLDEGQEP